MEVKKDKSPYDDTLNIQFEEGSKGKYTARSLIVDMDPYTIIYVMFININHYLINHI